MSCDAGKSMETTELIENGTLWNAIKDLGLNSSFKCFNIQNGNPRLVVRENISRTWHWSPIEGLNPEGAIKKSDDFIRQEIARMTIHPESGVNPTLRRKKGIAIGVARSVSTERYGIVACRLFAGEMDTAKLVVGDDGDAIVIKDDVDSKWKEELSKPLNLSEIEKKVIPKLRLLSLGMIPLQGYSLFTTSHHYDFQSMQAFTAVEKQVCDGCDQFSWWWKGDADALRDAVWHKAGHPVNISFKKKMASSTTVKQLLVEAGIGSAAALIPFLEAEVRKVKTYKTLLETVLPFFKELGGDLDWETLDEMLAYLDNFPVWRSTKVVIVNNAPIHLRSLDTREKVVAWIEQWCTKNAGNVAMCFGFYMAMAEKSAQFGGSHTLKTSYSLMALKKTNIGNYYLGLELFADYTAYKAKKLSQART